MQNETRARAPLNKAAAARWRTYLTPWKHKPTARRGPRPAGGRPGVVSSAVSNIFFGSSGKSALARSYHTDLAVPRLRGARRARVLPVRAG
jgi:hypothetical protein